MSSIFRLLQKYSFSGNNVSLNLFHVFTYSYGWITFLNNKTSLLMTSSKNTNVFANLLTKVLLKYFLWFLLHFKQLNINALSLVNMYSKQDLQFLHLLLWSPSERLTTRVDDELYINLRLAINFILYVIVLYYLILSLLILKKFCIFS